MRHASLEHVGIHAPRGETSTFLPPAANGSSRPLDQPVAVLDDFHGHLVVAFERLLGVGPKRLHLSLPVFRNGGSISLEVEPFSENNAKEKIVLIQSIAAEHPPRFDIIHFPELINDKIFERIVFHLV